LGLQRSFIGVTEEFYWGYRGVALSQSRTGKAIEGAKKSRKAFRKYFRKNYDYVVIEK